MKINQNFLDTFLECEGFFKEGSLVSNADLHSLPQGVPVPEIGELVMALKYIKEKELIQDGMSLLQGKPERSQIRYKLLKPYDKDLKTGTRQPFDLIIDDVMSGHLVYPWNKKDIYIVSFALKAR